MARRAEKSLRRASLCYSRAAPIAINYRLQKSGTDECGTVDLQNCNFEPVTLAPGDRRGLNFYGDYAIIGLSKPRDNKTFAGLPLEYCPSEKNAEA